ncbi:MAG: hypothetical protein L0226_14710 [Acidobacteria bacterium]|nr:hypothetical protein [Acidobacteriota bacterium]
MIALGSAFLGFVVGAIVMGHIMMFVLSKIAIGRLAKAVGILIEHRLARALDDPDEVSIKEKSGQGGAAK